MDQQERPQSVPSHPPVKDRWVKRAFLVVAVVAAMVLWWNYRKPHGPPGWGKDLEAALRQAKAENRKVVALFLNDPPTEKGRTLIDNILSKTGNLDAVKNGNFVAVIVIAQRGGGLPQRFNVKEFPVLLLLSPSGEELNRRVGTVGEVDFRHGFLDCETVVKP